MPKALKLVASLTSPYARKVRVVLAEKRLDFELVEDNPWSADAVTPAHNPLGKVPALLLDDGTSLFDSRVIVEYLDGTTPVGHLIPASPRERISARRWEAVADGVCDAVVAALLESRRPAGQQSAEWISRQEAKIQAGVAWMAAELGERPWCVVEYGLADIAVGCALGYLDLRFARFDWRQAHPNLARLFERLQQRPAFMDTTPVA